MPKEIESDLDEEFEEAPEEVVEEEPESETEEETTEKPAETSEATLTISLKKFPALKDAKVGDIIKANLRITGISEEKVDFEIVDLKGKKRKTRKQIEEDSAGSYRVRD
jgi:uncharacterized protein (UPF0218 family)